MRTFSVSILGSSSATPTTSRNPSAQLINIHERLILIDCGEGTQVQLRWKKIRFHRIQRIFISHLHGDHFFGLIGLISTMHLLGRKEPLHIYGPEPLKDILDMQLQVSDTELVYPLVFIPVPDDRFCLLFENDSYTVSSFPLDHRIPTTGFLIKEKQLPPRLNKEVIERENIPVDFFKEIRFGHDFIRPDGSAVKNEELLRPPPPMRSFAYCSDTRYTETIIPYINGVDLLYHESTFLHELKDAAHEKYHSTSLEAAMIAKKADAGQLVLGHYSARYNELDALLKEARKVFPNSILGQDGLVLDVIPKEFLNEHS